MSLQLPPELLALCFSRAHDLNLGDIIRASHVSQYWRAAALAEPSLWSTLIVRKYPCLSPVLNEELLARSRAVSLEVTMHIDIGKAHRTPDDSPVLAAAVAPFWSRVRSLKLTFYGAHNGRDDWYQARFAFLKMPAPLLKFLTITDNVTADSGSAHIQINKDIHWQIPHDFLGGGGALEALDVLSTPFTLPRHCPALATLVSFTGQFHPESRITEHLPLLCPMLASIKLFDLERYQIEPFAAGAWEHLQELRLLLYGPPESYDFLSLFGKIKLCHPIPSVTINATAWTASNARFLMQDRSVDRLEMDNLLVFNGQNDRGHRGSIGYRCGDDNRGVLVLDGQRNRHDRMLMQDLLARGPSYQNISSLSIAFYMLLPFLTACTVMPSLSWLTVNVPAGHQSRHWREPGKERLTTSPRRLLVLLGHNTVVLDAGMDDPCVSAAPLSADSWKTTYDWSVGARKFPALTVLDINATNHHPGDISDLPPATGQETFVSVEEVKALIEMGLGRLYVAAPRTLELLVITGLHFVDHEDEVLLTLNSLADEIALDQVVFGVPPMLPV